jgi:hypothetical protein
MGRKPRCLSEDCESQQEDAVGKASLCLQPARPVGTREKSRIALSPPMGEYKQSFTYTADFDDDDRTSSIWLTETY